MPKKIDSLNLPYITFKDSVVIDTETTGLNKMKDTPFLTGISINGGDIYTIANNEQMIEWMNENLARAGAVVFHNAKFDLHVLANIGLKESVIRRMPIWCTLVTETLINDMHFEYGLDAVCKVRFGMAKDNTKLLKWLSLHLGGKADKSQMNRIAEAPLELVKEYLIQDVKMTERLYWAQKDELPAMDLTQIFQLEMDTLKALWKMERIGVPVDAAQIKVSLAEFEEEFASIGNRIEELAGFPINTRSGKQLEQAFLSLGYTVNYTDKVSEKTGKKLHNPIFDKEALKEYDNELSNLILEQRSYGTMISNFLAKFDEIVHDDGRLRCNFNQTKTEEFGVITGRLSASDPNLQQIPNPKRSGSKAASVRAVFVAPEGYTWISADWEQFEFRIFAHYSNDPSLLEEFRRNPDADYHQIVADLTGLERNPYAKTLNLGLVFGMGMGLMAKKCDLPYTTKTIRENGKEKQILMAGTKAKALFEKYHSTLPNVRKMLKRAETVAEERGYVKTICGRQMRFHNRDFTYKAGGYIFQGSSADLMKTKLVELDSNEKLKTLGAELVLPVHDEFNFIVPDANVDEAKNIIKAVLEDFPQLRVPIKSDIGTGRNWKEASE